MKAIRYLRPDVLFALTPWHSAAVCWRCSADKVVPEIDPETGGWHAADCHVCRGSGYVAACGYTPPEGWRAETKERGPRCVECESIVEEQRANACQNV